ncbi:YopX family protein [Caminibacter profundus]
MREIKFKGYSRELNRWIIGDFVTRRECEDYESVYINSYELGENIEVVSESIGQYTGLKDKNGKEIYEDDIVEIDTGAIGKVVFDEECAYFCIIAKTGIFLFEDIPLEVIKVIGNIYENPELLEQISEN